MRISPIIYLIILTLFSCEKKYSSVDYASELKGKSFNVVAESKKDTVLLEINDTTYKFLNRNNDKLPFRNSKLENSTILVFDRSTMVINKIGFESYEGLYIGEIDIHLNMTRRTKPWNKKMLYGKCVEKKYINTTEKDFPPPPLPFSCDTIVEWPPYYLISEDQILLNKYQKSESNIEINNSAEYISMQLDNPFLGIEELWNVRKLNDSVMIVIRDLNADSGGYGTKNSADSLVLIRQRN